MTYIQNRDLSTKTFNQQLLNVLNDNDEEEIIFIREIIYITDSEADDSAVESDFIE